MLTGRYSMCASQSRRQNTKGEKYMSIIICALLVLISGLLFVAVYRMGVKDGSCLYEQTDFPEEPEDKQTKRENGWDNIINYSPDNR